MSRPVQTGFGYEIPMGTTYDYHADVAQWLVRHIADVRMRVRFPLSALNQLVTLFCNILR